MASLTPRLDQLERNIIVNGNFDYWQRGTTFTTSQGSYIYTADRFQRGGGNGGSGSFVISQSTDVPTVTQSGYQSRYSLLYTVATAATSSYTEFLWTKIEGHDYQQAHGHKIRLQFWAKSSVTGTYSLSLLNGAQTRVYATSYTISSANTWQKITLDIQLDTTGAWNFDNTLGLSIIWGLGANQLTTATANTWQTVTAGTVLSLSGTTANVAGTLNATFQLAQVMLIPQDFTQISSTTIDVPFQRAGRTIQQELSMCQRYYEKSYQLIDAPGLGGSFIPDHAAVTDVSGNAYVTIYFKVQKRAAATMGLWAGTNAGIWQRSVSGGAYGNANMSSTPTETLCRIYTTGGSAGAVVNLEGQWTADAEL